MKFADRRVAMKSAAPVRYIFCRILTSTRPRIGLRLDEAQSCRARSTRVRRTRAETCRDGLLVVKRTRKSPQPGTRLQGSHIRAISHLKSLSLNAEVACTHAKFEESKRERAISAHLPCECKHVVNILVTGSSRAFLQEELPPL